MPHVYTSSREKQADLWLGYGAWFALSVVVLIVAAVVRPAFAEQLVFGAMMPATAGAALVLGLTRGYAAVGLLLAAATVVGLGVVELPFLLLGLVVDLATGGPHTSVCANPQPVCIGPPSIAVPLIVGLAVYVAVAWFSLRGIHRRVG